MHGKILVEEKLANLVTHELFTKIFLTNIHRYTKNVFGIQFVHHSIITKPWPISTSHGWSYVYIIVQNTLIQQSLHYYSTCIMLECLNPIGQYNIVLSPLGMGYCRTCCSAPVSSMLSLRYCYYSYSTSGGNGQLFNFAIVRSNICTILW